MVSRHGWRLEALRQLGMSALGIFDANALSLAMSRSDEDRMLSWRNVFSSNTRLNYKLKPNF